MQRSDIVLAGFPFGQAPGMKIRPVLLLAGPVGPAAEILVAYVSTVIPDPLMATDVLLDPSQSQHRSTKLKFRSVIRLHKLATIHSSAVQRRLGRISGSIQQQVDAALKSLLRL